MADSIQNSKIPSNNLGRGKIQNLKDNIVSSEGSKGGSTSNTSSNKPVREPQGKPAKSMAELMARVGQNVNVLQKGQIIEGTIKKLTPGEILMDIGAKGDALVIEFDRQKLENLLSILKVGDRVKASVISPESEEGFPVVSLRRMLDDAIYTKLDDLVAADKSFEVDVLEATRGGYFVESHDGVRGFLPSSQVVSQDLVGKKIQVKLIEVDRAKKRVVFSEKATSFLTNPAEIRKHAKKGDVVDAIVTSVNPYGLYAVISFAEDIKLEGFVHISEIAYERVSDLSSQFKVGDKIKAEVLDIDENNRRINLSIKKTKKDEFADARTKYKAEDKVKGVVTDVRSRGVTVKLDEGLNGFIPSDKVASGTTYKEGEEVSCVVVDFDDRRRVIILSPVLKAVPIGYR